MLIYRQSFNLETSPRELIVPPPIFTQPQLIIEASGNTKNGRGVGWLVVVQQQILGTSLGLQIAGDSLYIKGGRQLFVPTFGEQYKLDFTPNSRLSKLNLSIFAPKEQMPAFNPITPTLNIESTQLASASEYKLLAANVPTLIADANSNRQGLVVFNPNNQDVVLATGINAQNQLVGQMAKISKDGLYELPVTAHGCYTGKIYALSAVAGGVSVTQFVPV